MAINAFAAARLDMALIRLDDSLELLTGPNDRVVRMGLLSVRGNLYAMRQLLEMESDLAVEAAADTERPSSLRVVR